MGAATMTEREPAIRRSANYRGDRRYILEEEGYSQLVGPDKRGIVWLPCHVEYDEESDSSHVIFRPVSEHEIKEAIEKELIKK